MTTSADPAARIQELAAAITAHRAAYYDGAPKVSDFEYDQLEDELRTLLAEHPDLAPDPNPLEQVGAPAVLHAPVRHERPMLSLDKATTPEQVEAFMARFAGQRVVVMPKLDGLSLSVIYEGGRLVRTATRGDGTTGEDVTPIARVALDGVPKEIPSTARIEIRGEAVMLRSTFAAYNAAHPDKPLVNPRNGAAGTLRQKDASKALDRRLAFFAFDIHPPVDTDLEAVLEELSLQTPDMAHADTAEEAIAAIRTIEKTRGDSDAVLEPVFISGTTVRRATLANQEVIRARDVRIGDTVLVRRAGDVIPFVAGPLDASKRTGEEREIEPPTVCPSCGSALEEEGNGRELYCRASDTCPAQAVRRLVHWASRAAADIEAVGPTWIDRLNDTGKLASIPDFYALTREDLLEYEGIGDISAERMIDSIAASRDVGLRRALIGFAIRHVGEGSATKICRAGFESMEQIADASVEDLVAVEDVGPAVAASLRAFFDRSESRARIALLR